MLPHYKSFEPFETSNRLLPHEKALHELRLMPSFEAFQFNDFDMDKKLTDKSLAETSSISDIVNEIENENIEHKATSNTNNCICCRAFICQKQQKCPCSKFIF